MAAPPAGDGDDNAHWRHHAIVQYAVPAAAALLANLMNLSPLRAVREARRRHDLGDLNPAPFAALLINCVGWVIYAFFITDVFIVLANAPGIYLGLYYSISGAMLASDPSAQAQLESVLLYQTPVQLAAAFLSVFVIPHSALAADAATAEAYQRHVLGFVATFNLLLFYSSPLSTVYKVVSTQSGASLHLPLILMSLANGLLFSIYGLALRDEYILLPNAAGASLGVLQLALKLYYRNGSSSKGAERGGKEAATAE